MMIRMTKYNPLFRTSDGPYLLKEEWTECGDIGKSFEGEIFTLDAYLKMEAKYIQTIKSVLDLFGIMSMNVEDFSYYLTEESFPSFWEKDSPGSLISKVLESCPDGLKKSTAPILRRISLKSGDIINVKHLDDYIKLNFRSSFGFNLVGDESSYVHFGWDSYVYIGTEKKPVKNSIHIPEGIFIEYWPSPHLDIED